MVAKVLTGALFGLEAEVATVEADLSSGLPGFTVVGLADLAVREAKERIRAALINEGYPFPPKRITVNLAPAGKKKEGTHFDLPIAVSILCAAAKISADRLDGYAFAGELSLDGSINRINGTLPLLIGLREKGIRRIFLPADNLEEGMLLSDISLYPVSSLREVISHFDGRARRTPVKARGKKAVRRAGTPMDFSDVRGQEPVKRAVTAAAAGGHGFLLIGPPGVGKTMISRRLPGILPPLSYEEQLEVTKIYSVAGKLSEKTPIITERPFRAPHHSLSAAALSGGGQRPQPGEISLAHRGVLFLDELPEFRRSILELLRTPMEDGEVTICRGGGNYTFPSDFMLAAAMNPCKCGYYGDAMHRCTCSDAQVKGYLGKLSGPLLDRIDMHIEMAPVRFRRNEGGPCLSTEEMKGAVEEARQRQKRRYESEDISCNSELMPALIKKYCVLQADGEALLEQAYSHYGLSARAGDKILRMSRTIADLEGSGPIRREHLAEALQYRGLDKLYRSLT